MSLEEGKELREEGIRRVSAANKEWLEAAREEAKRVCLLQGTVSAVELRRWAEATNCFPKHPNTWGAIFRGPSWETTGDWVPCEHTEGHARNVRVWTYVLS